MAEQRYKAVQEVISSGKTVTEVAATWRVSRQRVHTWLASYEAGGLEELGDRSHRPRTCPHQMPGEVEALVLELRGWKPILGTTQPRARTRAAPGVAAAVDIRGVPLPGPRGGDPARTRPATPTTTGKIERFHRTLRLEFDTRQVFRSLRVAQQALDEWVVCYNTARPHQSLADATPASRFRMASEVRLPRPQAERIGEQ